MAEFKKPSDMSIEEIEAELKGFGSASSVTKSPKDMSIEEIENELLSIKSTPMTKPFEFMSGFNKFKETVPEKGQIIPRIPVGMGEQGSEAYSKGFAQNVTLGNYPQIAAGLKSIFSDKPYVQLRDEEIARLKELQQLQPQESKAGELGGTIASVLLPSSKVLQAPTIAGKALRGAAMGGLMGALTNPGDVEGQVSPLQLEERIPRAAKTAAISGGIAGVAGGLEKGLKSDLGQKAMKEISDTALVKQTGAMLKDMRNLFGKKKVADIADTMRNQVVEFTDADGNKIVEKLYKTGDTFDDIAQKANALKSSTGDKIGSVYQEIDDAITNPNLQLTVDQIKKLSETPRFNPISDVPEIQKIISDKYGKTIGGKQVVSRVNTILEDFSQRSDSLSDSLKLKGELDDMINYAKRTQDLPDLQRALVDVRNFIRDKTNKFVDNASDVVGVKIGKDISKLNKTYGNAATIADIANDRVARESANRAISLTDYIAGAGIGGATAIGQGGLTPESAGLALTGALLNKGARKYGPGLISKTADMLSKGAGVVAPVTQMISPIAGRLSTPIAAGAAGSAIERRMEQIKKQKEQGR